jgi:hypothetical protein
MNQKPALHRCANSRTTAHGRLPRCHERLRRDSLCEKTPHVRFQAITRWHEAMQATARAAGCHLSQNSNLSVGAPLMRSTALHFLRGNRQREKRFRYFEIKWECSSNTETVQAFKQQSNAGMERRNRGPNTKQGRTAKTAAGGTSRRQ